MLCRGFSEVVEVVRQERRRASDADATSGNQVQPRKHERSNAMTTSIDFQGSGSAKCPRCGATIDTSRHKIGQSADAALYKAMGLKQVRVRCPGCKTEMDVIEK